MKKVEDSPIIKMFVADNNYYVYDTYTNYILHITPEHYKEIILLSEIGVNAYKALSDVSQFRVDIKMLIQSGFFKYSFVKKIVHPETAHVTLLLKRNISYIQLQVSRFCNFKCLYCKISHDDDFLYKTDSNYMSWDVAKRSVDFLYEHSKLCPEVRISFYGGEPLLNFDIIKKVVEYAKKLFYTKKINFHITTNASLLNDTIIDYMVLNNFYLLISLDGNAQIQNTHRKFLYNGGETFNKVFENVNKIKNKSLAYFKSNVRFNSVIFPDESKEQVYSFFEDNSIDKETVKIQYADMTGIDYITSDINKFSVYSKATIQEDEFFSKKIKQNNCVMSVTHPNGVCIPGVGRLFISCNGIFYPCEKVYEMRETSIGDLYSGFDIPKIKYLMNIGLLTEDNCRECWAIRFCSMCVCHCVDQEHGKISKELKLKTCQEQKKRIKEQLVQLAEKEARIYHE